MIFPNGTLAWPRGWRPAFEFRGDATVEPPSLDIGEMTDKGSINQRAVLRHRMHLLAELYAPVCAAHVIVVDGLSPV